MRILLLSALVATCSSIAPAAEPALRGELIFPPQGKHVHGSSIVECPNGDLLACWFYGSGERNADDVMVQGARLKKGTRTWSPVFVMADTPGFPDCNPVLFIDARQRLWLLWIAVRANRWERSLLKYRIAEEYQADGPPKWSWQDVIMLKPGEEFPKAIERAFRELGRDEGAWGEYAKSYPRLVVEAARDKVKRQTGWMTRIHPLVLPSGRILLPLYSDGFNLSLVAISDDLGETWRASGPIVGDGGIQPTIVRKKDGTLVTYLRDTGSAPGRALMSMSRDDGVTWSPARDTEIPNPSSSLEVIALTDGRWVVICNDTERGRHRLALLLSDDEGKTWRWKRHIEPPPGEKGSYAYPSMIQTRDGRLHMTYSHKERGKASIKHTAVDVEWITQSP